MTVVLILFVLVAFGVWVDILFTSVTPAGSPALLYRTRDGAATKSTPVALTTISNHMDIDSNVMNTPAQSAFTANYPNLSPKWRNFALSQRHVPHTVDTHAVGHIPHYMYPAAFANIESSGKVDQDLSPLERMVKSVLDGPPIFIDYRLKQTNTTYGGDNNVDEGVDNITMSTALRIGITTGTTTSAFEGVSSDSNDTTLHSNACTAADYYNGGLFLVIFITAIIILLISTMMALIIIIRVVGIDILII